MIGKNRNINAVLSYENNLLENGRKLSVVNGELISVDINENESTVARLLTQKIRSYLRMPSLSINELVEPKNLPLAYLNSAVFNTTSLKEYKKVLESNLLEKMKLPSISSLGKKDDIVDMVKMEIDSVNKLIKINDKAWHTAFEAMLNSKKGFLVSVKDVPKDGYRHVRVISAKTNRSYAIPLSEYEYFDVGYILGLIVGDL